MRFSTPPVARRAATVLAFLAAIGLVTAIAGEASFPPTPAISLSVQTPFPFGGSLSGSLAFQWPGLSGTLHVEVTDGAFDSLGFASSIRSGGTELTAQLDGMLDTPSMSIGIRHDLGATAVEMSTSIGFDPTPLLLGDHSIGLTVQADNAVWAAGTLRWAHASLEATTELRVRTALGEIEMRHVSADERQRSTYSFESPRLGLGMTHDVSHGETGRVAHTSWRALAPDLADSRRTSSELSSSDERQTTAASLPPEGPSGCGTCAIARPTADSDKTLGFDETMVGEAVESSIELQCNSYVFCWLAGLPEIPRSPFTVTNDPTGLTIPFGSTRQIDIEFEPTAPGEYHDSITIRYCGARWVETDDEPHYIGDDMDSVTGRYVYWCSEQSFPLYAVGLAKPVALATYTPESPICGKDVTFDASSSFDPNPGGVISSYEWTFDDGSTSASAQPTHRFGKSGAHTVTLIVRNDRGMASDPTVLTVDVSPDYIEAAATVGAAAAAGWATQASALSAPLLAAAAPGAVLAAASVIASAGAAAFPIDQLVLRFPDSWSFQDVQELVDRAVDGAEVIGFFSTLHAFLIRFPVAAKTADEAEAELGNIRETLERVLPPGTRFAKNYVGTFEGSSKYFLPTDIDALEADLRAAYDTVRAPEAWRRMEACDVRLRPTRIAVIDTGIDARHEEFMIPLRGRSYVAEQAIDQPWYEDPDGHGTEISGIIGAENGRGQLNGMLTGCAGQYEMQMYRVVGDMFSVWDSLRLAVSRAEEELESLTSAVSAGTRRKSVVINLSLGWDLELLTDAEQTLIANTFSSLFERYPETLFVSSSGNGDRPDDLQTSQGKELGEGTLVHAPGGVWAENHITVAATNAAGTELMPWSNHGPTVDIAAPGSNIFTAMAEGSYTWRVEGTSYAAAMVSGAAAALRSVDPKLTPGEVKGILMSSPTRIRSTDGRLIPLLDFADAVDKALESRIERNRKTLWWSIGSAVAVLGIGLLVLDPF